MALMAPLNATVKADPVQLGHILAAFEAMTTALEAISETVERAAVAAEKLDRILKERDMHGISKQE